MSMSVSLGIGIAVPFVLVGNFESSRPKQVNKTTGFYKFLFCLILFPANNKRPIQRTREITETQVWIQVDDCFPSTRLETWHLMVNLDYASLGR